MKLTKVERKFIGPAIFYDWKIEWVGRNGYTFWDGDTLHPVKYGATCKGLIKKGILELFERDGFIRISKSAEKYECKADNCRDGRVEIYNEDDDEYEIKGSCEVCNGLGVLELPRGSY